MVGQVRRRNVMTMLGPKGADRATAGSIDHGQVIFDPDAAKVELDVMIGAEAEYVFRSIRPVVRPAKRTDVRSFRVGSRVRHEPRTADLALVVVH